MSLEVTDLIDRYCAVWNEPDAACRKTLLEAVWAKGARYTDPRTDARGSDELLAHIAKMRATRPAATIARTTEVDSHHSLARFGWCLTEAGGTRLAEGIDVAELSPDGARIERIIGFFGPMT